MDKSLSPQAPKPSLQSLFCSSLLITSQLIAVPGAALSAAGESCHLLPGKVTDHQTCVDRDPAGVKRGGSTARARLWASLWVNPVVLLAVITPLIHKPLGEGEPKYHKAILTRFSIWGVKVFLRHLVESFREQTDLQMVSTYQVFAPQSKGLVQFKLCRQRR